MWARSVPKASRTAAPGRGPAGSVTPHQRRRQPCRPDPECRRRDPTGALPQAFERDERERRQEGHRTGDPDDAAASAVTGSFGPDVEPIVVGARSRPTVTAEVETTASGRIERGSHPDARPIASSRREDGREIDVSPRSWLWLVDTVTADGPEVIGATIRRRGSRRAIRSASSNSGSCDADATPAGPDVVVAADIGSAPHSLRGIETAARARCARWRPVSCHPRH